MKSLEIWSEIKDEATTFKKNDEDSRMPPLTAPLAAQLL